MSRGTGRQPRPPSPLRQLADRVGIIPEYLDQTGTETRVTSDDTRVALLRVMGIDASGDAEARRVLEELEAEEEGQLVPPVSVVPQRAIERGGGVRHVVVRRPGGAVGAVEWSVELRGEQGEVQRAEGRLRASRAQKLRLALPSAAEPGYHHLRVTLTTSGQTWMGDQSLIVVPRSCPRARDVLGGRRVFGVVANLYTVRSARNWGAGDLTDLSELLAWASESGAEFVGVNPLHALRNRGGDVSPYSPVSRLFRNPLYLDVEAVPELSRSPLARELMASDEFRAELERLRAGDRVQYERVMALKRPVLRALHSAFITMDRGRASERDRGCAQYMEVQGQSLSDFATFLALEDHLERHGLSDGNWRKWPEEYRDPRSRAVARFRGEYHQEIDFYCYLQYELDCQLALTARRARESGATIGLYQDLAVGTSPNGADTWMFPELFAQGASVGAPPDEYSASGQNWGLPPMDPRALARDRYSYWITLVRSSLRHAGALRIDHVMGLFRQFWIPEGKSGEDGAYIRFPSDDLLGILALESSRSGALIVGEDLGTVPEDVPPALRKWGILSSKVLYFERQRGDGFKPASRYEAQSLATANTHDMPTLEGFLRGRDIELKREVGLIDSDAKAAEQREKRDRERRALLARLKAASVLPRGVDQLEGAVLRGAVHEFLCRTPAVLVGLSLDDLTGEVEPVNLPGVGPEKFSSWTRRLSLPLESFRTDEGVATALRCHRARARA